MQLAYWQFVVALPIQLKPPMWNMTMAGYCQGWSRLVSRVIGTWPMSIVTVTVAVVVVATREGGVSGLGFRVWVWGKGKKEEGSIPYSH